MQGVVETQPMRQDWRHGGGKPGRASVTGSPDRCGSHSLIGVIDTAPLLRYFSVQPKRPFKFLFPMTFKDSFEEVSYIENPLTPSTRLTPIRPGNSHRPETLQV